MESEIASKILVVEDDITMEPLWRYVIETARPGATVEWVTSGEAAARRMRLGDLDLVISDIFLNGDLTGLDLWEIAKTDRFVLMSVITPARLHKLAIELPKPLPSYLQKPLNPSECIETIRALLTSPGSPVPQP